MVKHTISACLVLLSSFVVNAQNLAVVNLRCEYRSNPVGIGGSKPAFSWELATGNKNVLQTAYRILVADDSLTLQRNTGNIWDSKKVLSAASIQVVYNGKPLVATKKYFWKLMSWDNKRNVSDWSEP